jgi:hypothetical protein
LKENDDDDDDDDDKPVVNAVNENKTILPVLQYYYPYTMMVKTAHHETTADVKMFNTFEVLIAARKRTKPDFKSPKIFAD